MRLMPPVENPSLFAPRHGNMPSDNISSGETSWRTQRNKRKLMEPEGDGEIIDRPTDDTPIENSEIDDAKLPLHEFALLNKELDAMEDLMRD